MQGVRIFAATMLLLATAVLALPVSQAQAVDEKTFGVLPFTINGEDKYQYLSKGVQDMLLSRLYWKDHVVPTDKASLSGVAAPDSNAAAESVRSSLGVDYLVWGSVTIMGKEASLDMTALGADGQAWTKNEQTELARLIPALDGLAKSVNADLFGRQAPPPVPVTVKEEPTERVQVMNPGLVYNESKANQEFYLNPQFRYAGDDQSSGRQQSQRLPLIGRGMIVEDLDGDGSTEIVIMDEHTVRVYHRVEGMLKEIALYSAPMRLENLYLNALDMNRDGHYEIVVCASEEDRSPKSYILNLRDGKLEAVESDITYFLGVYTRPPTYTAILVGQRKGQLDLLDPKVYEMIRSKGKVAEGQRVGVPAKGNVFNLSFLPYKDDHKVILTDDTDRLKVYTPSGSLQFQSDTLYSGASVGVEYYSVMAGLNKSSGDMASHYYLPIRALSKDLDGDGRYELLVNHPVSVASQVFGRYRSFPQGEIQSLFWDGVGLNLFWKTRRIKGSVVDFGVGDVDGKGMRSLCVCVTTHPGAAGLGKRRTMVLFYPLDATMSKGATVHDEFKQDEAQ